MATFQKTKIVLTKSVSIIAGIISAAFCWYISNGLNGDYWYLLWVAPMPIILISLNVSDRKTFLIAFLAYLIGRLSWFSYLVNVATLIPAIIITIALPLIFAIIIALTKRVIIKTNSWYSVFAFPVFFTAFEWLMIKFSPDGTAASIAYSQSNCLPIIQIASITGILGITFMATLIPSVGAMAWHFRKEKTKLLPMTITCSIIIVSVLLFGFVRINNIPETDKTTVGLVVLDEESHKMGSLNFQDELEHTKNYALEIGKLAALGAKLIVLPERAINVNIETDSATIEILSTCAKQNHVGIVAGYTNFRNETTYNSALAIDEQGKTTVDYDKIHLVRGLEDEFVQGKKSGLFPFGDFQSGIAICKDLDFPEYINQYGRNKVKFLCIPAWDFVVDDWLHSRMAILRGIENGFSEVRTARLGRLTISDPFGRVNAEADCSNGRYTTLIGQILLYRIDTFYTYYGDWFGFTISITAVTFLLLTILKKKGSKQ